MESSYFICYFLDHQSYKRDKICTSNRMVVSVINDKFNDKSKERFNFLSPLDKEKLAS